MIITNEKRNKAHLVFGFSFGEMVTYCGRYFSQSRPGYYRQEKCKECKKEARRAGMDWKERNA